LIVGSNAMAYQIHLIGDCGKKDHATPHDGRLALMYVIQNSRKVI
jgi:hypothetical protein